MRSPIRMRWSALSLVEVESVVTDRFEAGGRVDRVADGGVFLALVAADRTDDRGARVEADPLAAGGPADLRPLDVQSFEGAAHLERAVDGRDRVRRDLRLGLGQDRDPEVGLDAVAHVVVDVALVIGTRSPRVIASHVRCRSRPSGPIGLHLLRRRRVALEVREHRRDRDALGARATRPPSMNSSRLAPRAQSATLRDAKRRNSDINWLPLPRLPSCPIPDGESARSDAEREGRAPTVGTQSPERRRSRPRPRRA